MERRNALWTKGLGLQVEMSQVMLVEVGIGLAWKSNGEEGSLRNWVRLLSLR